MSEKKEKQDSLTLALENLAKAQKNRNTFTLPNRGNGTTEDVDVDVNIAPPVPTDEVVAPKRTVNIRGSEIDLDKDYLPIASGMGSEGMDLVGAKVDIPDEYPLYSKDGVQVPIPKPVQFVLETLASLGVNVAGLGVAGAAGLVGLMGDLLVSTFGMEQSEAERLARDVMAMPEAFAGKLGTLPLTKIERGAIPKIPEVKDTKKKPVEPTVKPVETPEMTDAELGDLIRTAASKGMGSDKAMKKIIAQAKINPEIKEMAERLGFNLPFDIFSDSDLVKTGTAITREVRGSDAELIFSREVQDAIGQADNVINDLGATSDLSLISNKINKSLTEFQIDLDKKARKLYDQVDESIKKPENVELSNTASVLNNLIKELGGADLLDSRLKNILTRKNQTYGALLEYKRNVGNALKGSGPFKDAPIRQLKLTYGALADDQLANVSRLGGDEVKDILVKANELTAKKKAIEDNIISAMGKNLDGSLASSLRTSISTASKGEVAKINKTLELVPEELRREAVITAITTLSRQPDGQFGLAQYRKLLSSLENQSVIMNILKKNLGDETVKVLSELNEISKRITDARGDVSQTGKSNQSREIMRNAMNAESHVERFLAGGPVRRTIQAGVGGVGGMLMGVPYLSGILATAFSAIRVAPKNRLKMAGDLFNDTRFKDLINQVIETGTASSKTINDLANSPVYKRWAKTMGIEDPRNWLNTTIVGTADTDAMPVEPEGIPTEPEELTQSSALQSIIEQTDTETRDRILQQV